jgi:DNA-binding CsgD family transcriptional regulator
MMEDKNDRMYITDKEKTFLKYACQDLNYQQIADAMSVAERTACGYRDSLFEKFGVRTRIGLVLEAIKRELVEL